MSGTAPPPPGSGTPGRAAREAVDRDVPAAVRGELEAVLGVRLREAAQLDGRFARDVADRVAAFTLRGGKRLRAQFLWWGARAAGGPDEAGAVGAALRLAAALELVQTCALVHDDVMDGSALRRGGPALHTDLAAQYPRARRPRGGAPPFAQSAAVLAGDLALTWADDACAEAALTPDQRRRVARIWRAMRTEMVAGQYLDLHAQALDSRSAARALRTAYLKSARYSVEHPLDLGTVLGDVPPGVAHALRRAGSCAGLAFQLHDDLLGTFGDPARTGKPSGDDIRDGKPTYLVAVAFARSRGGRRRAARGVLRRALGNRRLTDRELARVREALVETGARDAVEARVARLAEQSRRHLDGAGGIDPVAAAALHHLLGTAAGDPASSAARSPSAPPRGLPFRLAPQGVRA